MQLTTKEAQIAEVKENLHETDASLVRYVEDLLTLLMNKKVLEAEEVPQEVKSRIAHRRKLRYTLRKLVLENSLYGIRSEVDKVS